MKRIGLIGGFKHKWLSIFAYVFVICLFKLVIAAEGDDDDDPDDDQPFDNSQWLIYDSLYVRTFPESLTHACDSGANFDEQEEFDQACMYH